MESETRQGELMDCSDDIVQLVIGAAIDVHRELGPGLLESAYELAMLVEFQHRGICAKRQVEVPVIYRGAELGTGFRADFIIEEKLILELKAVDRLAPVHTSQLITYLKLMRIKRGLLLNFNVPLLKQGIKRISI